MIDQAPEESIDVPKFSETLGRLTKATVRVTANASFTGRVHNDTIAPMTDVVAGYSVYLDVADLTIGQAPDVIITNLAIPPFSWATAFSGGFQTQTNFVVTTNSVPFPEFSPLTNFLGQGSIPVGVTYYYTAATFANGTTLEMTNTITVNINVTYEYEPVQLDCRQINIAATFKQGDAGISNGIPIYFGYDSTNGRARTKNSGCALCSLATMLTAFPSLQAETPLTLNMQLTNIYVNGRYVKGFNNRADVKWWEINRATGQPIGLITSTNISGNNIDAYLTNHICGHGDGVILQLNETITKVATGQTTIGVHFVLVTGRTNNNDWAVFDPGWQPQFTTPQSNLFTLSGHYIGFTNGGNSHVFTVGGVRTYRLGSANKGRVNFSAESPIELLITDPSGKRVGWDGTKDVIEITDASYFRDYPILSADDPSGSAEGEPTGIKTAVIPNPVGGTYKVVATGTGAGVYTLDFESDWPGSGGQSLTYSGTAITGVTFTNTFFVIVPPVITSIFNKGSNLNFSFATQTNVTYSVESKASLTDADWIPVQIFVGTGDFVTFNSTNSAQIQFYHVKAQ